MRRVNSATVARRSHFLLVLALTIALTGPRLLAKAAFDRALRPSFERTYNKTKGRDVPVGMGGHLSPYNYEE